MAEKKLTLTVTLAASLAGLSGCSSSDDGYRATGDTRVCADDWGQRIADDYCERRSGGAHFLYLGRGAPIPYYYDNLNDRRYAGYVSRTPPPGGSFVRAPAGSNMARSSAISRGGLGSSGRSFGRGG